MNTVWRHLLSCVVLAFGVSLPDSAYAWSALGHRFITAAAVEELPAPLRTYFQNYKTQIKNIAAIEPPDRHYIDIDYYPEFFAHTFPRDLAVLLARYVPTTVTNNGLAPWTAVGYYETLRAQFAAARTAADWTNLLAAAGNMAHFLEDLHNPMHLALNYDGQLTGQTGLHTRYEGSLIQYRITAGLQLVTNLTDCLYYPSLRDAIFADIDLVYPGNTPLLAADLSAFAAAGNRTNNHYYQHLWDDGCSSFTPGAMQKAAGMVASAWYSAWREAGFPKPFGATQPPPVKLVLSGLDQAGCHLSIIGDAGQRLELQTSTNLINWIPHTTFTNLNGRLEIAAPGPDASARCFYRAALSP